MISIELDREDKLTIAQWEDFLAMARKAGAGDDTPVEEVTVPQDDSILTGWRVQAGGDAIAGTRKLALPAWLVHDLLRVVTQVAHSDGDVRGLQPDAQEALVRVHAHLIEPVVADDPYDQDDSEVETK